MCIDIVEILFGIVNGQICQLLTESSTRDIFSFLDNNLSKCQGILTRLGTCIDIKEVWFWNANGQISSIFTELSAHYMIMAGYYRFTFFISFCLLVSFFFFFLFRNFQMQNSHHWHQRCTFTIFCWKMTSRHKLKSTLSLCKVSLWAKLFKANDVVR